MYWRIIVFFSVAVTDLLMSLIATPYVAMNLFASGRFIFSQHLSNSLSNHFLTKYYDGNHTSWWWNSIKYRARNFWEWSQISTNQERVSTVFSLLIGKNVKPFPENTVLYQLQLPCYFWPYHGIIMVLSPNKASSALVWWSNLYIFH